MVPVNTWPLATLNELDLAPTHAGRMKPVPARLQRGTPSWNSQSAGRVASFAFFVIKEGPWAQRGHAKIGFERFGADAILHPVPTLP